MKISFTAITESKEGTMGQIVIVRRVSNSTEPKELILDRPPMKPEVSDYTSVLREITSTAISRAKTGNLKITSHSHCIFE